MRFGINTFLWTVDFEPQHLELLPRIKENGFDGIEMFIHEPARVKSTEIRRGLEAAAMGCTFCSVLPSGVSMDSEDAGIRKQAKDYMAACMNTVAETGAEVFGGPFYTPLGEKPGRRRNEDEWKRVVECWQELAPLAESLKLDIAIEPLNRFETHFLNTTSDACALVQQIGHPRVGILFDTFHSHIEEKHPNQALRKAMPHVKHFHASENDRGTPGTGHVNWTGILGTLKQSKYDRWVTIESFGSTIKEIAAAACIWRDLAPSNESIAFEGVAFLRQNLT